MGKNPDPSWEELELIFAEFAKNSDEQTIHDAIEENLTIRRNKRFIRQRKRHYDVAVKVLQAKLEREVDPIIVERKQQHYQKLGEVCRNLVINGLDAIRKNQQEGADTATYWIDSSRMPLTPVTFEEMKNILGGNLERAEVIYDRTIIYEYLQPHLKAECQVINSKGFLRAVEENPYEVIECLRLLADRGTFQGVCPVCAAWQ